MSTITCVFWLQSGAKFAELQEPDWGTGEIGVEFTKPRPPSVRDMVRMVSVEQLDEVPPFVTQPELLFKITEDPQLVAAQYAVGRRRFHYRETSGWKSDEQLMGEDVNWGKGVLRLLAEKMTEENAKHLALLAAGAFPNDRWSPQVGYESPFSQLYKALYHGDGLMLPKHFYLFPPLT